jgi:hypothetical protein
VTHRTSLTNLRRIQARGLPTFVAQQTQRMQLLQELLEQVDDGRAKSFFCLSAALLPIREMRSAVTQLRSSPSWPDDKKQLAKSLRQAFAGIAARNGIELLYRQKQR